MSVNPNRVPVATYRLQLNADFNFDRAREIVDYLADLGVSDLYLSPILQARQGSDHGYDVCDPTVVSEDLGGEDGFRRLADQARARNLRMLLDIVPNHMAANPENLWWVDTVANGESAPYARVFDINWHPLREGLRGRVLLPILGASYAEELIAGELRIEAGESGPVVRYYEWEFPLVVGDELSASLRAYYRAVSNRETAQSGELLDVLLSSQHYQLAYWRSAAEEINYRRFFDIADLAALRAEDPEVFDLTHAKIIELVNGGLVDGLRIDHIDGLLRPAEYLERLRQATGNDTYVLVEKILTGPEPLRESWNVAGTTGYDFLNIVNGTLADGQGADALTAIFRRLTGTTQTFHELVRQEKLLVIEQLFSGDLHELARRFVRVADHDPHGRDLSMVEIQEALAVVTACLPTYRTYIHSADVDSVDRETVLWTISSALDQRPGLERAVKFIERVLLFENQPQPHSDLHDLQVDAVERWQQFSGPVMAKGLEDTSLYIDTRLVSLNAVGGEPDVIAVTVDDLHSWAIERAARWPATMNTTSTHDAKRSEDVNARINVLSEIADAWEATLSQWRSWNVPLKPFVEGEPVPGPRAELLLYQTLLGAWPLDASERSDFSERIQQYMLKAAREAKQSTSWVEQHPDYEEALLEFVRAVLDPEQSSRFLDDLQAFVEPIAFHGALNSLTQVLLKVFMPGVPDFYRGCELWDLSLVDPDNRRPVNFDRRRALLSEIAEIEPAAAHQLFDRWEDGAVKLWFVHQALAVRRELGDVFEQGAYSSLTVGGRRSRHLIAFSRQSGERFVVVVLPRLTLRLLLDAGFDAPALPVGRGIWDDTWVAVPESPLVWRDRLTGERHTSSNSRLPVGSLFDRIPFAILLPE